MMRLPRYKPMTLGDLTELEPCPMCEGEGLQTEIVWSPGQAVEEHEVSCFQCQGAGHVVALMCGRCGREEYARPDELARYVRCCPGCGHEASNDLWLNLSYTPTTKVTG